MTTPAFAKDHLEPDPEIVRTTNAPDVVDRALRRSVVARVLVRPSFQQEYAVGLDLVGGHHQIFSIVSSRPFAGGPRRIVPAGEARPLHCEMPVDAGFAASILSVWLQMLQKTRESDVPRRGMDGNFYNFALISGGKTLTGRTWSPPANSETAALVGIAISMRSYCETRDENWRASLERDIAALLARLSADSAITH